MTITARKPRVPSLVSIALVLASPGALASQAVSARPASVALTVVVPPHAPPEIALAVDSVAAVVHRSSTGFDVETTVGLGSRAASRIEVRLGAPGIADSARIWVQNRHGTFEPLVRSANIVAFDAAPFLAGPRSAVRFRIESSQPSLLASMTIPVEYRLTVGAGDEIAVWSFPAVLRFAAAR